MLLVGRPNASLAGAGSPLHVFHGPSMQVGGWTDLLQ